MEAEPLLRITGLSKRFGASPAVLEDINLNVRAGECVVVLGSNGSGKSTMMRCIVRLHEPSSGHIVVAGNDLATLSGAALRDARRAVAIVSQQANLVRRRSALANVATGELGRRNDALSKLGVLPADALKRAYGYLEQVGLAQQARQRAGTLSGGQAQRVAIARALAQRPAVLLADEPVASLDPEAAEGVMSLLRSLADGGLGVLCVLHQPDLALRHAHRVVGLRAGRMMFDDLAANVSFERIAGLYVGEAA